MSRIAYLVSDYYAPSHTFIRREIAGLRARGMDIIAFSVQPGGDTAARAENILGRSPLAYAAALVWAFWKAPGRFLSSWRLALHHRPPGLRALLWSQFHFVEAMLLSRLLLRGGATRLHCHFANSGATVGLLAANFARLPWSLTLHGISETDYPAGLLLAEKLERAAFVACASYFMRAQAMRMVAPAHWRKIIVVRCGIDLAALPAAVPHRDTGPARIICVGRLSAEKGYFGLLDALAAIEPSAGGSELVIIGDGPMAAAVQAHARELGLLDRIRFAGACAENETLTEIACADILVLPSLMEGLPVVLVEAMALGRPVLASRVAGVPELVVEGTGYLFTPSDWEDLKQQLAALLGARDRWPRMGRAGRKQVEAAFRADQAAERMARLFADEDIM